ncbi:MAG: hypothetical protein ACOC7K_02310 [bacterium]
MRGVKRCAAVYCPVTQIPTLTFSVELSGCISKVSLKQVVEKGEAEKAMILFIEGFPAQFELIIIIVIAAVIVVPFWRIFSKAGFSGAFSLLMVIPLLNLIMIFVLAFADWPALRQQNESTASGQENARD